MVILSLGQFHWPLKKGDQFTDVDFREYLEDEAVQSSGQRKLDAESGLTVRAALLLFCGSEFFKICLCNRTDLIADQLEREALPKQVIEKALSFGASSGRAPKANPFFNSAIY